MMGTGTGVPGMRHHRRAFTLVELVLSMIVTAILLGGIASAVRIAGRAIDDGTSTAARTSAAREVLDRITADLAVAINFSEQKPESVTFTVPDRSGDGLPETIRYRWGKSDGDSLTYEYNGSSPVSIAEDVYQFDMSFLLLTTGPPPPPPEVESAELVLASHDDAPGGWVAGFKVRGNNWCGQYFRPTLPTNVLSWTITRVKFHATRFGPAGGNNTIEVWEADASELPIGPPLAKKAMPEGLLPLNPAWVEMQYETLDGLDPSMAACLVIGGVSGNQFTGEISYEGNGTPMPAGTHFMVSWDGGTTWLSQGDIQDMRFYIYGTVTTDGPAEWP